LHTSALRECQKAGWDNEFEHHNVVEGQLDQTEIENWLQ